MKKPAPMPRIAVRMPRHTVARIAGLAERDNVTPSELLRSALDLGLAKVEARRPRRAAG